MLVRAGLVPLLAKQRRALRVLFLRRHDGFYCVRLVNVHGTLCLPLLIAASKILSENACSSPETAEGIPLSFKQKYRGD